MAASRIGGTRMRHESISSSACAPRHQISTTLYRPAYGCTCLCSARTGSAARGARRCAARARYRGALAIKAQQRHQCLFSRVSAALGISSRLASARWWHRRLEKSGQHGMRRHHRGKLINEKINGAAAKRSRQNEIMAWREKQHHQLAIIILLARGSGIKAKHRKAAARSVTAPAST